MITGSIKRRIRASILALLLILSSSMPLEAKNMAFPQGVRLNNPGNLKKSEDDWQGLTRLQPKGDFPRFISPHYGIRALVKTLVTYSDDYGLNTISSVIYRYAPPSENNTTAYINDVSRRTGYTPNEVLDMEEPFVLIRLAQAIVIHENGLAPPQFPPYWYEDVVFHRAVIAALEDE